jgi:uncharacterized membrane protein YjjB (DUF3815 family)
MDLIYQLVTSLIASAAFGFIFNSPAKLLPQCGFIGMLGWLVYYIGMQLGIDVVISSLAAAFLVSVISQLFSRLYKSPIIVFSVAGIIPLVPGGLAYDAMRNVVEDQYDTAVQLAVKAFMISGAIAIGLIFSEVVNRMIARKPVRKETENSNESL